MNYLVDMINTIYKDCFVLKDHTKTCINIRAHEVYPRMLSFMRAAYASPSKQAHAELAMLVDIMDHVFDAAQIIPTDFKCAFPERHNSFRWYMRVMNSRPIDVILLMLVNIYGFKIVHECDDIRYNWESIRFDIFVDDPTMITMFYDMQGVEKKMLISRRLLKTKFMSGQWRLELA